MLSEHGCPGRAFRLNKSPTEKLKISDNNGCIVLDVKVFL